MNLIRSIISAFLGILLVLSVAGWIWFGNRDLPNIGGARFVLAVCGLSSAGSLWLLWSARPSEIKKAVD